MYGVFRYFVWQENPTWDRVLRSLFLVPDFSGPWVPIYYPAWTLCFEIALFVAVVPIPVPFGGGAYFSTLPCLEFAAGLLMAEAWRRGFALPRRVAFMCLGLAVCGFAVRAEYQGLARVIVWGVPAALLVIGALSLEHARLFRWRALIAGGDASYALYLFHVPVMEGLYQGLIHEGVDLHSRTRFVALREVVLLATATLAGLLIHSTLERPILSRLRATLRRLPGITA